MTIKKKVAVSIVGAFALVGVCFVGETYRLIHTIIPNSYAAWTAGDLLVEYMNTHSNKWPRGWEDLRSAKENLEDRGHPIYWKFEDLPQMVKIDWTANPPTLAGIRPQSNEVPFRVVTKPDGSVVDALWGQDTEPNRRVYEYLRTNYVESNQR